MDLSKAKSAPVVDLKVGSTTGISSSEYEIKIRSLNSQIEALESQLRTMRVDYESQLRNKDHYIRELEEKMAGIVPVGDERTYNKPDDSKVTTTQSGVERLSSSQHSSGSGSQIASSYTVGNSNVSGSGVSSTGGMRTYGTYGNTGGNVTSTTYTTGTTAATGVTGTTGTTGATTISTAGGYKPTTYSSSG